MKYTFFRDKNGHPYTLTLACDLAARNAALSAKDVTRVEVAETCRVVYRRVPTEPAGIKRWKKPLTDLDIVQWFNKGESA